MKSGPVSRFTATNYIPLSVKDTIMWSERDARSYRALWSGYTR